MPATIHDDIDAWLAAAVHDDLRAEERAEFEQHLIGCADCRTAFEVERTMSRVIAANLNEARPDAAFEQRVLARFRGHLPRAGLLAFVAGLMQLRATQIAAVAAMLLALTQVGRWLTTDYSTLGNEELAVQARVPSGSLADLRSRLAGSEPPKSAASPSAGGPPPRSVGPLSADARGEKDRFADSAMAKRSSAAAASTSAATAGAANQLTRSGSSGAADSSSDKADASTEEFAASSYEVAPAEESGSRQSAPLSPEINGDANRKLIRNASVELEVRSFDEAAQKITAFAAEDRGYVATTSSDKQANGKLRGEIVVKVLPENLDAFLGQLRGLGELKNQTLGTQDVTKQYLDTDARLKNGRAMEQRLLEILKKSDDINDLLQVEKELGRVRAEIEQMQGELKFMDAQVQFATVTITLAEKDMNVPAAFLLKERAQLALFAAEVEKTYGEMKALASAKVQITSASLDRDNTGRVSARVSMLIAPEESDAVLAKTKSMGRVGNFQVQTERVAQGGTGMSENAKTERDKVELNITISREEQEEAVQQTSLSIRTSDVNGRTRQLRELAEKQSGRIRSSSFSRDPNGREYANVSLRVAMKNYAPLMQSLNALGKLENVSVHREDRPDAPIDEATAPADVSIQVYSQGNIVSEETGIIATVRRTLAQSAAAIMWSLRMIGVAVAFFVPWIAALALVLWVVKVVRRKRAE